MTEPHRTESFHESLPAVGKAGTWFIVTAIAFIVLGTVAIFYPFVTGLAVTTVVAWLLMIGGMMHLISAFRGGGAGQVIWQIVLAVLYVFAGLYFLSNPLISLATLTMFLSVVLFAESLISLAAYFSTRGLEGAGWLLVNAVVSFLLAAMIWRQWPSTSVWFVGTLVGVNLIVRGFSRLMFGTAAKQLAA